jgi:hypothetical protein
MASIAEQKVFETLELTRDLLSEEEYREVYDLNDHVEWGVAVELLADSLVEKEAKLTSTQFAAIESAFEVMKMSGSYRLSDLRKLVVQ